MKLILVRHTSVAIEKGICYGHTDVPLSESFPYEADEVKKKLSGYKIDAAYTSPLTRCRKLAEFCGFHDAIPDKRLMEMNFGEWEMKRYDEISDPRLQLWYDDFLNVAATGGESAMMQRDRFKDFLRSLQYDEDKTIAVFTHGGILIHALVLLRGMSYEEAYATNPGYGSTFYFNL
ncbi:MAG: alpha-ribazole phosphatase [Muribaculum sp.]|nr:alpha-ribazole phosphatase [Muribaculum sp.]